MKEFIRTATPETERPQGEDLISFIRRIRRGETLGLFIRQERRRWGLTLKQAGALCLVSYSYLSEIENGLAHPSYEVLIKIANGLHMDYEKTMKLRDRQ
jgi:hypothetical protein